MKNTKKLLKSSFEKGKFGLEYLRTVAARQMAPVLFVKGENSDAFIEWLHQLFDDSIIIAKKDFEKNHETLTNSVILVNDVRKLRDDTVEAAMSCRSRGLNVVVSLSQHPKILDYVVDPSFKLIEVMEFSAEIHEEIDKVRKKIS